MKYSIIIATTLIVATQSIFSNITCYNSTDCQSDEWCYDQWQCVPKCNVVDGVNCTDDIGWNYECNDITGECDELNCNNTANFCDIEYSPIVLTTCTNYGDGSFGCEPTFCQTEDCPDGYACFLDLYCIVDCTTSPDYSCSQSGQYCNTDSGLCEYQACNTTDDCVNDIDYFCQPQWGVCLDRCSSSDGCPDYTICDVDIGECVVENCGNSDDPDFCINYEGPDRPECVETEYMGEPYYYCSEPMCYDDGDCDVGYICGNYGEGYQDFCRVDCRLESDWYCADYYGNSAKVCNDYGYCDTVDCVQDVNCTAVLGDGFVCGQWGECEEGCSNNTFCVEKYDLIGTVCNNGTGQCELPCMNDTDCWELSDRTGDDYKCNNITNACERIIECVENPMLCAYQSMSFGVELVCDPIYGECEPFYCNDTSECSLNGTVCTSLPGFPVDGEVCTAGCSSDYDCEMRFGNLSWDGAFICNNETSHCELVPECVADPTICMYESMMFGVELRCEETWGNCEPFNCSETSECTLNGTICGYLDGFDLDHSVCFVGCESDMECNARFSNFTGDSYTCEEGQCLPYNMTNMTTTEETSTTEIVDDIATTDDGTGPADDVETYGVSVVFGLILIMISWIF